jgi:hypothetical protein
MDGKQRSLEAPLADDMDIEASPDSLVRIRCGGGRGAVAWGMTPLTGARARMGNASRIE